jgi:hypothetical protein
MSTLVSSGLSAGPSYVLPTDPSKRVVPVASAGLVRVTVESPSALINQGAELTAADPGQDNLVEASAPAERRLARVAQTVAMSATPTEVYAWVIHPGRAGT